MKEQISICNIVTSFKLDRKMDLENLYTYFKEISTFNKETFNKKVIVIKNPNPKISFLIYRTGSVVATGIKELSVAKESDKILKQLFKKYRIDIDLSTPNRIQNIVAIIKTETEFDIEKLSRLKIAEYEPEQFPGMIFKFKWEDKKATFLIFDSKKIVCLGSKNLEDLKLITSKFLHYLKQKSYK